MNEQTKHIEQVQSECAIGELSKIVQGTQAEDAIQDVIQILFEHSKEGYLPIIIPNIHSGIAELPNILKTIISAVITSPLTILGIKGDSGKTSVIESLVDAWNIVYRRLKGNNSIGISNLQPLAQTLSLQSALKLLSNRTVSGLPETHDGIDICQVLFSSNVANSITVINDCSDNWAVNKGINITSLFPNITEATLGCKTATNHIITGSTLKKLSFPNLEEISITAPNTLATNTPNVEDLDCPSLRKISLTSGGSAGGGKVTFGTMKGKEIMEFPEFYERTGIVTNHDSCFRFTECRICYFPKFHIIRGLGNASVFNGWPKLEELYMPNLDYMGDTYAGWPSIVINNPKLIKVQYGIPSGRMFSLCNNNTQPAIECGGCPKLIDIEFRGEYDEQGNLINGSTKDLYFDAWQPDEDTITEYAATIDSNILNHIAARIMPKTNGKVRFHTSIYNILSDETKSAFTDKGYTVQEYVPAT